MDVMTEGVREAVLWCKLYIEDIVLCTETREKLQVKLERWRRALEKRGLKMSRTKTKYMCTTNEEEDRENIGFFLLPEW